MDGSEGSYDGAPPPFLTKTYEMVDDPMTNSIVSWSQSGLSFVVWNPLEFATELLPFYFKHNNFSSFVRQLNTYGFRKMDRDHWEFGNEGFIRGQTHLLKTIHRRKPIYSHSHSHGNEAPLSDTERQELKLKIKTLHKKNATLKSQMEEHENEKEQIKGQIQSLSQQLWRMGNEQKEMIRKMEAELEKHNRGGKKRKMGKLSEVLVDQDWLVPPLEVMGKLELWMDLVEDMEKEVKVVKESGQNGMNDGFWEQFLTEIPHISNSGDVCLHTRNSVVR